MDLVKQYIIQAFVNASNNLRLSSEKIEVVALIRDHLNKCANLEEEISRLKKITEFSKFAIKLGEIHYSLVHAKVDFIKFSENFKNQSQSLISSVSNLLDIVTPPEFGEIINRNAASVNVNLSENKLKSELPSGEKFKAIVIPDSPAQNENEIRRDKLKEEIIFDGIREKAEFDFKDFEEEILKPIKILESMLVKLENSEFNTDDIKQNIEIMKNHSELAGKVGFKVLANMHIIFAVALKLIMNGKLLPEKQVIVSMRACLIVIVAVVRGKEVDITNYLNSAEKFGEMILSKK
ncbi:MAG: hypothetical protein KJ799_16120 [Bacteroidetes bacterium]|nr:hypothetical protein [Bacteroidota bacterium]MBU2508225.1 hypothetical protein [Bacteroidota bacterium]